MQKRSFIRKAVSLMAEYRTRGANRMAFVRNVSEKGMHMVTLSRDSESHFFPGKNIKLKLLLSTKESVPLLCEVRWVTADRPPHGLTYGLGLEIINPSPRYVSFVKALS